jgi:hypothetical protein
MLMAARLLETLVGLAPLDQVQDMEAHQLGRRLDTITLQQPGLVSTIPLLLQAQVMELHQLAPSLDTTTRQRQVLDITTTLLALVPDMAIRPLVQALDMVTPQPQELVLTTALRPTRWTQGEDSKIQVTLL